MDFQNELKKRRMHAINTENTTALYAKANEVADFIETEIINSIRRHHFVGDNKVRFSYIPEAVNYLEHKSVLYSPNFNISQVGPEGSSARHINISYPKIYFPTDGIFLGNVANLLKMQKIAVKEINRDRGYIIFEWSLDTQEWVTDSANGVAPQKTERRVDNLSPEEREKFDMLWIERARNGEL